MSVLAAVCVAFPAFFLGGFPLSQRLMGFLRRAAPRSCCLRILSFVKVAADLSKGFVVVTVLSGLFGQEVALGAAIGVFLGHVYPVLREVDGGYGMAVLLGALIAFNPLIGLVALVGWTFGYYVFRYAGLAALSAAIGTPVVVAVYNLETQFNVVALFALAGFIFWRQREHLVVFVGRKGQTT